MNSQIYWQILVWLCITLNNIIVLLFIYYKINSLLMTLRLASGSYDGTIRFWDPGTGTSIPN